MANDQIGVLLRLRRWLGHEHPVSQGRGVTGVECNAGAQAEALAWA